MKNKLCKLLIMTALLVICLGSISALAATGGDSWQNATSLKVGEPFLGHSTANSVEWFSYTVESEHPVYFAFQDLSGKTCFTDLYFYDNNLSEYYNYTDAISSYETLNSRLATFPIGTKLYIQVKGSSPGSDYSLSVFDDHGYSYKLDGKWESENNDSRQQANVLTKSEPLYGILNTSKDVDFYKYIVSGDGTFSVKLINQTSDYFKAYLTVYDSEGNQVEKCSNYGDYTFMSPEYSGVVGSTYYFSVSYNTNLGITYQIAVDDSSTAATKVVKPLSILKGTNVVVGYATPDSTVYVQISKKKYTAKADENGLYKVKTSTLKDKAKIKIWEKVNKETSEKSTYTVTSK